MFLCERRQTININNDAQNISALSLSMCVEWILSDGLFTLSVALSIYIWPTKSRIVGQSH